MLRPRAGERGDTIVEVLIAIAIVSLVLGGAYVTTNRSLLATRSAQERGNALKLVESQLEQLKGLSKTDPDAIFGYGTAFCVPPDNIPVGATDPKCRVNSAGTQTTAEPSYRLSITQTGNTFSIVNTWTDVGGKITDNVSMVYRLYE